MRSGILIAVALLGTPAALGQGLSPVPVVVVDGDAPSPVPLVLPEEGDDSVRSSALALETSVGLPAGATVAVAYRAFPWLRAKFGAAHNGVSGGVQGGLTVGWLTAPFTPTLSVEGGLFTEGDATGLARRVGVDVSTIAAAHQFGYEYGSAQAGLEFGWPQRFTFQVRAGLSYVGATLHQTQATIRTLSGDTQLTAGDVQVAAVIPSATLGCVAYLF